MIVNLAAIVSPSHEHNFFLGYVLLKNMISFKILLASIFKIITLMYSIHFFFRVSLKSRMMFSLILIIVMFFLTVILVKVNTDTCKYTQCCNLPSGHFPSSPPPHYLGINKGSFWLFGKIQRFVCMHRPATCYQLQLYSNKTSQLSIPSFLNTQRNNRGYFFQVLNVTCTQI